MAENIIKPAKIKLPAKKAMNLYRKEKTSSSPTRIVPIFILLAIVVFLIAKFGVIDRMDAVNTLRDQNSEASNQLNALRAELADYAEVRENYRRYTKNYLSPDESLLADRLEIISLIESTTENLGIVSSISIVGNSVSITVNTTDLDQLAAIRNNLEETDWVLSVTVHTAARQEADKVEAEVPSVSAAIVFEVMAQTEEES